MAGPKSYILEVGDELVVLFKAEATLGAGLNTAAVGDFSWLAAAEDLSTMLPAMVVIPISATYEPATFGEREKQTYEFRAVYARTWAAGDRVFRTTVTNMEKFRQVIADKALLPGLSLANGQILKAHVGQALPTQSTEEAAFVQLQVEVALAVLLITVELEVWP